MNVIRGRVMRQKRSLIPAALAAMLLVLVAAPAARAAEGPGLFVKHEFLASGDSREMTAGGKTAFTFRSKAAKAKVECKALKLKAGATINGASRNSGATGKEVLEFSECRGGNAEEGLAGCEPTGGKVTTTALLDKLGYATSSRTGGVLVQLAPESGTTLATIKFSGEKCIATSATMSGQLIAEVSIAGTLVEVGSHEVEAAKVELKLAPAEKKIWTETEGTLSSSKGSLTIFGAESTAEGTGVLELSGSTQWGPIPTPGLLEEAYSLTPRLLEYHEVTGEEKAFRVEDIGTDHLELRKLKVGGGEAAQWEVTDKHFCATSTITSGGHCEITVKLLKGTAGSATFEGEILFVGGTQFPFSAKGLVN